MSEEQIKDYLQRYEIKSEDGLANHILQLKTNTFPNIKLISELVWVLEDKESVFYSFLVDIKELDKAFEGLLGTTPSKEFYNAFKQTTSSPTFMDEVLDSNTTVTEVPNFNLIDIEQILPKHILDTLEKQEDKKEGFNYSDHYLADEVGYFKQCGKKETKGKLFYELDFEFIKQMAERMQSNKDNSKYELWNWKKPLSEKDVEELKQAMWRHIIAVMSGELEDDGRPFGHLEAISNNAMMINYQLKLKKC